MTPCVLNKRRDPFVPGPDVYIGRGSPWGNPFVIGKHGDRDEVCDRFEREILPTLDIEPLRGKNLMCYCAPRRCHGDSILRKLNETAPTVACETCQGNGEIVTDWDRYLEPHDGDNGDEAVAECPECDGYGVVERA